MEAPGVPTGSVRGRKGKEGGRQGGGWGGEAKNLVGVGGR
jgi:hypothetical protein